VNLCLRSRPGGLVDPRGEPEPGPRRRLTPVCDREQPNQRHVARSTRPSPVRFASHEFASPTLSLAGAAKKHEAQASAYVEAVRITGAQAPLVFVFARSGGEATALGP
jgi:hypothetical protein